MTNLDLQGVGAFTSAAYIINIGPYYSRPTTVAKILVVEDDDDFSCALAIFLKSGLHEVDIARNGISATDFLQTYEYDLIILDLGLPGRGGHEICQWLRERGSKILILVLSGKQDITNKTQLLEIGADDYLTKPVDLREVRSRILALLRRKSDFQPNEISVGDLVIDTLRQKVSLAGKPLELGKREFQLLEFMAKNPDRVLPVELIFQRVWPTDSEVNIEAVRTGVKRLRQKVDPDGKLIETAYGAGYIFNRRAERSRLDKRDIKPDCR